MYKWLLRAFSSFLVPFCDFDDQPEEISPRLKSRVMQVFLGLLAHLRQVRRITKGGGGGGLGRNDRKLPNCLHKQPKVLHKRPSALSKWQMIPISATFWAIVFFAERVAFSRFEKIPASFFWCSPRLCEGGGAGKKLRRGIWAGIFWKRGNGIPPFSPFQAIFFCPFMQSLSAFYAIFFSLLGTPLNVFFVRSFYAIFFGLLCNNIFRPFMQYFSAF